jgi:hypothetical protein
MSIGGMNSTKRVLPIYVMLLLALEGTARAQGTVNVTFEIPSEPAVQVGGPVFLDLRLQNSSSDTVRVNMGPHAKWNYEFALVGPDGTTTEIPPYRQYGPGPKSTMTLAPHETQSRRLVFNEWYTFRNPGEYLLKVQLTVLLSSSANVSWQKEFFDDLRVQVAPHDPERLKEACAKLAAAALDPGAGEAATTSSFALSYVTDPVAVTYLARILKEGSPAAREDAIHGLARVGTSEAVEVLKSNLATADSQLRTQIQSALSQIRPGS